MYLALFITIRSYWKDYGGFSELFSSPFFHFSFAFALLHSFGVIDFNWASIATQSLPTILGFSLAAYTITFTLMGSALHRALSKSIDGKTGLPLISMVNATFFHVILFQSVSLVYSLSTAGTFFWKKLGGSPGFSSLKSSILWITYYIGDFIGCLLSIYSVFLLFSIGIAMFRLGRLTGRANLTSVPSPTVSNDNLTADQAVTISTWRFKILKGVAKVLGIYK